MLSRLHAIGLLIGTLMAVAFLAVSAQAETLERRFVAITPPRPAPQFVFQDDQGQPLTLQDLRGHYVLLNIWATWCGPCVREMPSLDRLQAHFDPQNFQVIALAEDHDAVTTVRAFYARHRLKHLPIYVDTTGQVPSVFRVSGLPTTVLIDPQGRVVGRVEGSTDWSTPDALAFLERQTRF